MRVVERLEAIDARSTVATPAAATMLFPRHPELGIHGREP
jgi:hypothetical protein